MLHVSIGILEVGSSMGDVSEQFINLNGVCVRAIQVYFPQLPPPPPLPPAGCSRAVVQVEENVGGGTRWTMVEE